MRVFPETLSCLPKSRPPGGCKRRSAAKSFSSATTATTTRAKPEPSCAIAKPTNRRTLNFAFENKIQRKFSPLYLKRIPAGWQDKTALQLPNYVGHPLIDIFKKVSAANVADFCLEMYRSMGLLDGIRVVRSSDPDFRRAACDVPEFFVDVPYEGEIVRARFVDGALKLHEGGDSFVTLPLTAFTKEQISPDARHAACAGCNRLCIARITLPERAKKPIFARKKRRKSLL